MSKNSNKLIEQSHALDSFFESLMRDVAAYEEQEQSEIDEVQVKDTQQDIHNLNDKNLDVVEPEPINEDTDNTIAETQTEKSTPIVESKVEPVKVASTKPESAKPEPVKPVKELETNNLFDFLPPIAPETTTEAPVAPAEVEVPQSVTETDEIAEPIIATPAEIEHEVESEAEPETEKAPLGKPEWAESDFQVMLFKVAGLSMAVPLVELNGIVECDLSEVTTMPGHADFYLGLMNHLDKTVPIVDTARFVLPPDKLKILASDNPEERITRVVMINDCQYGLACDEVNEVVTLSPEEVRWRTQRTQRRWLAGTVIEHMCALIDANAFAELLASQAPIQEFRN